MSIITEGRLKGRDPRLSQSRHPIRIRQRSDLASGGIYHYHYQYLHMPDAQIIDGPDGIVIQIEGIDETVRVSRLLLRLLVFPRSLFARFDGRRSD
jgi:hypothetical protein